MGKMYRVTITDIAREAKTSVATVSRIINGSGHKTDSEVKERVLKIINETGYTPNPLGRMLQKNDIMEIGVVLPTFQNPFYTQILSGIENAAVKCGYDVVVYCSKHEAALESKYIKTLMDKRVKAMIISPVSEDLTDLKHFADNGGVVASLEKMEHPGCIWVDQNCDTGATLATEHLIACGHRDIALLTLPLVKWTRKQIFKGFAETLARHGIPMREESVIELENDMDFGESVYEFECGRVLAGRFSRQHPGPTAILTVNDITAFGIIQALTDLGVKVPDDVSVVGFDNIYMSPMITPRLTTVNTVSVRIGETICRTLIEHKESEERFEGYGIQFETELVVRNSVKNHIVKSNIF